MSYPTPMEGHDEVFARMVCARDSPFRSIFNADEAPRPVHPPTTPEKRRKKKPKTDAPITNIIEREASLNGHMRDANSTGRVKREDFTQPMLPAVLGHPTLDPYKDPYWMEAAFEGGGLIYR